MSYTHCVQTSILALGVLAAILWSFSSYTAGRSSRQVGAHRTALATQLTDLVFLLPWAFILHAQWRAAAIGWGALSAVAGSVSFLAMYSATAIGPLAIAEKLRAGLMTVVPFVAGLLLGERPGVGPSAGVILIVLSVVLIMQQPEHLDEEVARRERHAVRLALVAGVAMGLAITATGQTKPEDGVTPLVVYRVGIAILLVSLLVIRRQKLDLKREHWNPLIISGFCGATGEVAWITALQHGPLSVVPAIVAVQPGITALLARFLANERLRRMQIGGIVVGIVGLVAMKL